MGDKYNLRKKKSNETCGSVEIYYMANSGKMPV